MVSTSSSPVDQQVALSQDAKNLLLQGKGKSEEELCQMKKIVQTCIQKMHRVRPESKMHQMVKNFVWKMHRVRLESKIKQMVQNFIWKMWMIKLVFKMIQKVHRAGARTFRQARRRQSLWPWNRIHGGPYNPRRIAFLGNKGIQVPLPANATAEDLFKLYVHEGIIDHLVRETNLYAQQYIAKEGDNLRPHSLASNWEETYRVEMIAFLAMLRLSVYWSQDTLISTPVFGQLI